MACFEKENLKNQPLFQSHFSDKAEKLNWVVNFNFKYLLFQSMHDTIKKISKGQPAIAWYELIVCHNGFVLYKLTK